MKVFNIAIVAIALGGILSGCAAPGKTGKHGAYAMSGQYLGKDTRHEITPAESRLILPAKPALKIDKIIAGDVGPNRYEESIMFKGLGFARYEEVYRGGFGQVFDRHFRKLGAQLSKVVIPVPYKTLTIKTKGRMKYATFTTKSRPCVLFAQQVGEKGYRDRTPGMVTGLICDRPGFSPERLAFLITSYIAKIKKR
ncbi:hypothetical protein [Varunaivibrio sulfuroxidans]|uniref:Lipoprotein n=1 Tax=Varunaivibrio sulfuroxidans TaxID=1773489 RepID=A0A4R3JDM0_9PROT|nr:hypothetical protein [Varunaivibrio sulfuroxidans]TCS64149.1 hypothetical protein EDD55_102191 [Varunaivibrio sulfuroxidans]WES31404.1 hypothetical protein P3M64_03255 [Varunaivibrio sulfuroxidans]